MAGIHKLPEATFHAAKQRPEGAARDGGYKINCQEQFFTLQSIARLVSMTS
jgi:hypothetical protein